MRTTNCKNFIPPALVRRKPNLVIPFSRYADEYCALKEKHLAFCVQKQSAYQTSGRPICCSLCDPCAFSHGYRGNAWQFEREVIRVIPSNGSVHKYRIQIKANWTPACVNKELNCLRVFGTSTTLFASAVLLFFCPEPSSSLLFLLPQLLLVLRLHGNTAQSSPEGFPDCAANVHICRWSLGGLPKKCLPASL